MWKISEADGAGICGDSCGAFLAEHSVFPSVASGRPDARDKAAMEDLRQNAVHF